jgi:hypothetical protein|tara:strand:+ start:311 stop:478 length:168 start_codon:yes stop_codon:yes gene_type:complete
MKFLNRFRWRNIRANLSEYKKKVKWVGETAWGDGLKYLEEQEKKRELKKAEAQNG